MTANIEEAIKKSIMDIEQYNDYIFEYDYEYDDSIFQDYDSIDSSELTYTRYY